MEISVKDAEPAVESVTLTLTLDEALYVAAELADGNSSVHPGKPSGVYEGIVEAIGVYHNAPKSPLTERFANQRKVTSALRSNYNYESAKSVAESVGFNLD